MGQYQHGRSPHPTNGHENKLAKKALKIWKNNIIWKGETEELIQLKKLIKLWEKYQKERNQTQKGLSFRKTGKYTSQRHETAKQEGKITAGKAAKIISKSVGEKVLAKDIKKFSTEWHHSGFFKNGMGKTWFFSPKEIEI